MGNRRWERVKQLQKSLEQGVAVADNELLEVAQNSGIGPTNAEYAAFLKMIVIAPFAGYRMHLSEQLLNEFLYPLVLSEYSTVHGVISWIQFHLEQPEPFEGMSAKGLDWLKWIITQPDLIQHALDRIIEENEKLLITEIREYFAPFCRIPLSRITFYREWNRQILNRAAKAILFIQHFLAYEQDDSVQERKEQDLFLKLATLTDGLATHDPQELIKLFVLNWEGYFDMIERSDSGSTHELFLDMEPRDAQIVWTLAGKGFRIVPEHLTDLSLLEKNTLDLLHTSNTL